MSKHENAQQRREFAAQLRLLAQQVEAGEIDCMVLATYAPCPDPRCSDRHVASAFFGEGQHLVPMLGAIRMLEHRMLANATITLVAPHALRPVPEGDR